ncbi:uncharacterized protein [Cardiocondyla obscurior]|uniref:uncharacterized protein n=1 Tax=Cardiocondyla obscurior TaxID=286306 RepID=UPI00396589B1
MSTPATPSVSAAALKKRRATIKGACTRIAAFANGLLEITDETREQAIERRNRLKDYWEEYDRIQSQLEEADETEDSDRVAFEEGYYSVMGRLSRAINVSAPVRSSPAPSGESGGEREIHTNMRLPKLSIPSFSGRYEDWFPFVDTFKGLIHNNQELPGIQKFQYLKGCLTDEAKALIAPLEVSDENYEIEWNTLNERYNNKRVIVSEHIRLMLELPQMHRENATELRSICDGLTRHLGALKALKTKAESWDVLLIYLLSAELDQNTRKEWHASLPEQELPTMEQFMQFLRKRSCVLESMVHRDAPGNTRRIDTRSNARGEGRRQALHATATGGRCVYCRGDHAVYSCGAFAALPVPQRIFEIRKRNLCLNCLRSTAHRAAQCAAGGCKKCKLMHNTLLHLGDIQNREASSAGTSAAESTVASGEATALCARPSAGGDRGYVFLSTAIINVFDGNDQQKRARVLLDSGSQAHFMTKRFAKLLNLNMRPVNITVTGVGRMTAQSTCMTRVRLRSRTDSFESEIECIVTNGITEKIPASAIGRDAIKLPTGLKLADPQFHQPGEIDMLIGADLFWSLICVGRIKATTNHPTLQKTKFGWILAGRVGGAPGDIAGTCASHAAITCSDFTDAIERFWRIEEAAEPVIGTMDEQQCEKEFIASVATDQSGRYIVGLPIKNKIMTTVGQSREIALKRFYTLERRLNRDPEFRAVYVQFMREYAELGHMRKIDDYETGKPGAVYLPHHGIYKRTDGNAKLRVVFDASCKTSSGVSLNDALQKGPTIQQDLTSILIRFRALTYVFSADIVKMYRQIRVRESQTHLQRIFWRDTPGSPVVTWELLTVTYGTTSAPFLAIRCLQHLARKHAADCPIGSERILRDFYVDDLLTGANTLAEAKRARDEIVEILRRGCFRLSKWLSNNDELIPEHEMRCRDPVTFGTDAESKILGIQWDPSRDEFGFRNNYTVCGERITKRGILAEIASLFDPLGLLGPVAVVAKLILQDTWQCQLGWEESVPPNIHHRWLEFRRQLTDLEKIRVPRWIGGRGARGIELHGFCDASERAYGACIYARTTDGTAQFKTQLLTSKSRMHR